MWAIVIKEFNQLRRDRRMVAMLVAIPLLLLIVFGYAASFDVSSVPTVVVGPQANVVSTKLPALFDIKGAYTERNRDDAVAALRDGTAVAAVVTQSNGSIQILVDGSELFSARSVAASGQHLGANASVQVLFNPELTTSVVMVPGLIGIVLVFIGTLATALGVVRERQAGTLEQLAVMPFRPWEVFFGKVLPYFLVAAIDTVIVVIAGVSIFGVPFLGSIGTFTLGVLLFLFVTLGIGVLISTVSQNQGQAMQLAMMTLLPQVLLSGLLFPVTSMAAGVRWISYLLPLTYFIRISRGVLIKATPIDALWFPLMMLAILGIVVFGLSVLRFRHDLAANTLAAP